jgi:peptide/nickel transport system substrate-binding protein/oligopeptide transport system substrate-binding protein
MSWRIKRMRAIPEFEIHGARATQARGRARAATLFAFVGALTLVLSACNIGGAASGPTLAANQTFTWPYVDSNNYMGHNTVLDPAQIITAKDYAMVNMIYTNLVTFTPTLGIAPDAATHWDVSADGKSYTFHLRPNLKFSDGDPITASDFAYSLDRAVEPFNTLCNVDSANTYAKVIDPSTGNNLCAPLGTAHLNYVKGWDARFAGSVSSIIANGANANVGLDVIDPLTLRINLTQPIPFFLDALTYPTGDVLEKSLVTNPKYPGGLWVDHLDTAGCSGPFKIKSYGAGKVMTLVPNPNWETAFGKKLTITQVVRPVVQTTDVEYSSYIAGQYDYTDVSLDKYQIARGQNDFHDVVALETDYFGLNFTQAPFDNLQVRQAFDLALNKQLLVDGVETGGAVPTNHIVPQGMPGFYPGLLNPSEDGTQSLSGNAVAATSLLGKAQGNCSTSNPYVISPDYCPYIFGKSPKEIDLWVPSDNPANVAIAKAATIMWNNALGVNVVVKQVTFDALVGNLGLPAASDPMPIWEIGWIADYPDPQDWLTIQFGTGALDNAGGMSDRAFDTLVTQADVEKNPTTRMQEYNRAEQIAVDEVGWIPYQQSKIAWRLRQYVHGFNYNRMGVMVDISWPSVYIAG